VSRWDDFDLFLFALFGAEAAATVVILGRLIQIHLLGKDRDDYRREG
jgi:hypothetical protein